MDARWDKRQRTIAPLKRRGETEKPDADGSKQEHHALIDVKPPNDPDDVAPTAEEGEEAEEEEEHDASDEANEPELNIHSEYSLTLVAKA